MLLVKDSRCVVTSEMSLYKWGWMWSGHYILSLPTVYAAVYVIV